MSRTTQKDLFGDPQPDLFGEDDAPHEKKTFRVRPEEIRQWFEHALMELQDFETWPWTREQVCEIRVGTWVRKGNRLGNPTEAKEWIDKLQAEADRLDRATGWPPTLDISGQSNNKAA
jgi:hypothetical protein